MEAMDIQAVESKLSDVTVTAIPMSGKNVHKDFGHGGNSHATISTVPASSPSSIGKDKDNSTSKYAQLLAVIEEMGKEYQMPVTWTTKLKWHTGFSADSVEWCPVECYRSVLVCGTYQLEKKDEGEQSSGQKRLGKLCLFIVDDKSTVLSPIQSVDTAGILDQKWCHHLIQDYPVLAVVTSDGYLDLYRLTKQDEIFNLKLWIRHFVSQGFLALSLDWSSNKRNDEVRLVISDSSGDVTVVKLGETTLQRVGVWRAHDFEAWIVAFNYWNPHIFYSGGDDCLFKCYDVRLPDVPFSLNRCHDAGVTAIRNHADVEHQLLTGSYDEKVRLWDTRNLRKCVTEKNVSGGVWRLKWHPYRPSTVLAACMYGGFRLLNVEERVEVVCEYLEHDSIAYGADWTHDDTSLVATCSFYDCKMHISEISM